MNRTVDLSIYRSEYETLRDLVEASPDRETGGELLGLWSHHGGATVMLVTGPAPNARREVASFAQPAAVHMAIERFVWSAFGLQVLGIWHSHHRLGILELSPGDLERTARYSRKHGRMRYAEILGTLEEQRGHNTARLRPYIYADAQTLRGLDSEIRVLPGLSPIRAMLNVADLPRSIRPCLYPLGGSPVDASVMDEGDGGDALDESSTEGQSEQARGLPITEGSPDAPGEAESEATRCAQPEEAVIRAFEGALRTGRVAGRFSVGLDLKDSSVQLDLVGSDCRYMIDVDTKEPTVARVTAIIDHLIFHREINLYEGTLAEGYAKLLTSLSKRGPAPRRWTFLAKAWWKE